MIANLASFTILLIFFWGRSMWRKDLRLHIATMLFCLTADLLLVVALVVTKDALSQVDMSMHWTLMIHIPIAVSTILIYFATALSGFQLYRGNKAARPRLRALDKALIVFRVLTLVTSIMVYILKIK